MPKHSLRFVALFIPASLLVAQERVDLSVVNRIKNEAFQNSKVMEHAFYLTDVYGARIAASPEYRKAAEWCVKRLKEYGMEDARLEKWGEFGKSWSYTHFSAHLLEPVSTQLIGLPLAWSPGTNGPQTGEVIQVTVRTADDIGSLKGKLKGKWVMTEPPRDLALPTEALGHRYTDAELAERAQAPDPGASPFGFRRPQQAGPGGPQNYMQIMAMRQKLNALIKEEGALGVISAGLRGESGTIFHGPAGSRTADAPPVSIALATEHYNRIARLLAAKIPVKVEVELKAEILEKQDGFNVIGNLPGGRKKDEIVMIGGHLDSWHGGTGATDNAAGVAVMMEAVRILNKLNLKTDRTVRIGLWDAEEQGLIGSREYVKANFADPANMSLKKEHGKLSGYFNIDNGSGKIRGVYLQRNDAMRPVFEQWFAPFRDLGVTTVTIRNTGGTDHEAFDEVGLPGFQFIQDPLDYMSVTHHGNMDTYDHAVEADLMQASAVIAALVYDAANRPDLLPRKELPRPSK